MLKPACFLFVLFFFSQPIFSQKGERVLTITPALLPMKTIGIQPGFQFPLSNKFALLSEVTIPVARNAQGDINKFSCFRISSELKYYRKGAIDGKFIGVQLGYTYRKLSDTDSGSYWTEPYSKTATGYSSTKINSPVIFFNLKLGDEIKHWGKFYMDYFLALGIRFIPTRFDAEGKYGIVYQEARRGSCTPIMDWDPAWENERDYIRPSAALGIRIGLKL